MSINDLDLNFVPEYSKLEHIPEGMYRCEIVESSFYHSGEGVTLRVIVDLDDWPSLGRRSFHMHAFDQRSASAVGRDLALLGYDTKNWTVANGRPFTKELAACEKTIIGCRFIFQRRLRVATHGRVNCIVNIMELYDPDKQYPYLTVPPKELNI